MNQTASWTHHDLTVNGIKLHYVTQGEGPLMLMLHGFPEFWYSWRHQIPAFASDYKVVAPDLRGYNLSEKPPNKDAYQISTLVEDIKSLIHELGYEHCILVGHDWGGAIAWRLTDAYPALVKRLIVLNMPHPARFAAGIKTIPQLIKSWYIFFFQLPLLPEWILSRRNFEPVIQMLQKTSVNPAAYPPADLDPYRQALAQPGAIKAMLNYYRNIFRQRTAHPTGSIISVPTLLIWGENDAALGKELTVGTEDYVSHLTVRYIPNCSHWVQREQPETVNRYIREWIAQNL